MGASSRYYGYDDNGNLIARASEPLDTAEQTDTFTYDGLGQLSSATVNGVTTTFAYSPDGKREYKSTAGVITRHVWDGDKIALDLSDTSLKAQYLHGLRLIHSHNTGAFRFYIQNPHGDVVGSMNANTREITNMDYDAFGNLTSGTTYDPFGYCGEYFDSETGFIYLRARYYDPSLGRFITEDPHWNPENMIYGDDAQNQVPSIAAIVQSGNLYVYCRNNPTNFIDPTGNYDREAAIAYAYQWYNSRNSAYYSYWQDCANFVSQCLFAGGIKMNSSWYSYKGEFNRNTYLWDVGAALKHLFSGFNDQYFYDWDVSGTWSLAKNQYEHFSDPSNGYINGDVLTIKTEKDVKVAANNWGIQKGDLIYWSGADGKNPHHAAMVSKIENGEIYYTAHTNPAFIQKLSLKLDGEQILVIRIRDDAELGFKL